MFTEFETDRLQIRAIQINDADFMFDNWTQELDIARYMTWKPHQEKEQTKQFIVSCLKDWENESYTWIIESKITKEIMGSFAARKSGHKLDIGYLIVEQYWGKGYMTEVVESFVENAFKIEGIRRIGAVCDVDNPASKRVMEKSGMSYEGVLKSWLIHPNMGTDPRDCHCLSIVKKAG